LLVENIHGVITGRILLLKNWIVLISSSWESEFPLCNLRKIPRYMSDHNPLIVRTDMVQQLGSRPFCFQNSWLQHAEFTMKVREI
jgi:hypothetical protein